nr:hypothetical protein [uncultured Halomonas sp.]
MENINLLLGQIASMVTILGFLGFLVKKINRYKNVKEKQRQKFESLIKALANQATTAIQRQDVFIYANETLGFGRHIENRIRFHAGFFWLFNLLMSFLIVYLYDSRDLVFWEIALLLLAEAGALVLTSFLSVICYNLAKINDAFAQSYIEEVNRHISKSPMAVKASSKLRKS